MNMSEYGPAGKTGRDSLDSLPDYLALPDLLALGLSEDTVRAVLRGEPQLHRDELADRLALVQREGHRS
jgi:hypothetical protein